MTGETENVLKGLEISQQFIDALKTVMYLFPRAHSISYLHTEMILMWFYLHERELFERITETVLVQENIQVL